MKLRRRLIFPVLLAAITVSACAQKPNTSATPDQVSTEEFTKTVTQFLGKEIGAHLADIKSLEPPQERVVGALTVGEFSWGTYLRAVASYSALSGERTLA
jgi:ABC-type Fe3+-hydroxamate transport system substrate-binding protein